MVDRRHRYVKPVILDAGNFLINRTKPGHSKDFCGPVPLLIRLFAPEDLQGSGGRPPSDRGPSTEPGSLLKGTGHAALWAPPR